jgi:hypothetical protein
MVDALLIVPVPKQRNIRDENDDAKAGTTPEAWGRARQKTGRKTRTRAGPLDEEPRQELLRLQEHVKDRQYDVAGASETAAKPSLRGLRTRIQGSDARCELVGRAMPA